MLLKFKKYILVVLFIAIAIHLSKLIVVYGAKKLVERYLDRYNDRILPEARMNTMEIIRHYGYPAEKHSVVTSDGYILEIHRIPNGRLNSLVKRDPVLLQHGVSGSSGVWITNGINDSLGFVLADHGYDVFLGNVRGNIYSRRHISLTTNDPEFWNYTLDEHALIDLPAMIDYILNITGFNQLTYIGHSLGTSIGLLSLAGMPNYNPKVKLAVLESPVAYTMYSKTAFRLLATHSKGLKSVWNWLTGSDSVLALNEFTRNILNVLCSGEYGVAVCDLILSVLGGYNDDFNRERIHAYMPHAFTGTSWNVILQAAKFHYEHKFTRRDLGPSLNLIKYGQAEPLEYDLSSISTPIICFWSYMDLVTDKNDLDELVQRIPSIILLESVPNELWTHFDFHLGKNATAQHYKRVLEIMKNNSVNDKL